MASSDEPKPTAVIEAIHFNKIPGSEALEMVADVLFKNPTPYPVSYMDANYKLENGEGKQLIEGSIPDAGLCQSHGEKTFDVLDTVKADDAIELGGTFSFKFSIDITIDLLVFGKITIHAEYGGETSIPETLPISKEGGTTRLEKNKEDGGDDDDI